MIAESQTGYCYEVDIYTGAKGGQDQRKGLGYQVVMDFAKNIK
jgi:hypothetical protein